MTIMTSLSSSCPLLSPRPVYTLEKSTNYANSLELFSAFINTIALPDDNTVDYVGFKSTASGWGRTGTGKGESQILFNVSWE
jgi:hypothetical protein